MGGEGVFSESVVGICQKYTEGASVRRRERTAVCQGRGLSGVERERHPSYCSML